VAKAHGTARRRGVNTFAILAGLFAIMAAGVVLALLFAPRKPEAPPASTIAFQPKPDRPEADFPPDAPSSLTPRPRRNQPAPEEPASDTVEEKQEGRCILEGSVTESETGKPINRALVLCVSTAQDHPEQRIKPSRAYADKDGHYALRVEIKGAYFVEASYNGFLTARQKVELSEDQIARADFSLSRGARISGRVMERGSAAPAVGVHVFTNGRAHSSARTDPQGRYTLSGLLPGEYEVRLDVSRSPYMITGMAPMRNASIRFETQEVTGVDFMVDAAGQVWGYVTTRDRKPMPADVVLCSSASMISQIAEAGIRQAPPVTGRADANGYYELSGVPLNKEWRVMAMPRECAPQLSAPFLLSATQRTVRIDMHVSPGSNVYGYVVDTGNSPIPDAEVVCLPSYGRFFSPLDSPQALRNATSDAEGRFTIPNLPIGEYQIMARKDGYKFAAIGEPVYPDGTNDIHGVRIALTPVESGKSTVYGTVTDASGAALPGVRIELAMVGQGDMSAGGSETETDASGAYRFDKVPEGFLMLVAQKAGYQSQNVTAVKLDEPTDIVMQSASVISGTVLVRETGKPPTGGYSVRASAANIGGGRSIGMLLDGASGGSFNDPQGSFSITVGGGDYTIEARAAGLTPGREFVSVAPGQQIGHIIIYLREAGGRIEGRVTTPDGKSPQGALVWTGSTANPVAGMMPGMDGGGPANGMQVGADGSFAFTNLAADTYQIHARLEGYAQAQTPPIALAEGQQINGVTIALGYGNALQGTVQFNGYLEPGAFVGVVGNGVSEITSTDAQGRYRFERLPAGVYLGTAMSLSAGGAIMGFFSPLHGRIEIVEGQPTVYNFGEPTNTALEGRCVPPPPGGYLGYAILQQPGAPPVSLNVANPLAWFQDQSGPWQYVMGMAPVTSNGYFRIDNLVGGQYQLDVFMSNLGEVMLGNMRQVFHGMVDIADGQVVNMNVEIAQPERTQGAPQ